MLIFRDMERRYFEGEKREIFGTEKRRFQAGKGASCGGKRKAVRAVFWHLGRERDAPKRRAVAEGISEGWRGNRSVLVGNARFSGGIFWCGGEAVHRSLAEEMQKKFTEMASMSFQVSTFAA